MPTLSARINATRAALVPSFAKKTPVMASSKRVALLSVTVDNDGETATLMKETPAAQNDTKTTADPAPMNENRKEQFRLELNPSSAQVKFCSNKNIDVTENAAILCDAVTCDATNSTNNDVTQHLDDNIDHITTVSVDVHAMETVRGTVKASPVSSAGMDCSCEDSCACSSYESDEDHNDLREMTTNSIACQGPMLQTFLR